MMSWCKKIAFLPKFVCSTAFLLTILFGIPQAQSSKGLNVPVILSPIALLVAWVITYEGCPRSACKIQIWALLGPVSWRNSTSATQPLQVLSSNLKQCPHSYIVPQCCFFGHFLSWCLPRVWMLARRGSPQHLWNISQAMECVTFCFHQLGFLSYAVYLFYTNLLMLIMS